MTNINRTFTHFRTAATVAGFSPRDWELQPGDEGKGRPWMLVRHDESNTPFPRVLGHTAEEAADKLEAYTVTLRAVVACGSRLAVGENRADRFELDADDIDLG